MSRGLYICATWPFAGKNMLTIGMGLNMQKKGINFGYMKPVGNMPIEKNNQFVDEDAVFVQEVLGFSNPENLVTPVQLMQDFKMTAFTDEQQDYMPLIKESYKMLSEDKDYMLVHGAGHCLTGKYCNLDGIRIIKELDLHAIFIDRLKNIVSYDMLLALKDILGDRMLGVILNDVQSHFLPELDTIIKPFLNRKGIPVLGVIPSDPLLRSIRASELAIKLGGRLIASQNNADRMVENFLVGTMQVENFMNYFRRQQNSAVIVGGDRADVQLVAIEGECPCLVLTGNLFPNDIILSRADALHVPIILVRDDTFSTARKMENLLNRNKMHDPIKSSQANQLVSNALDIEDICTRLKN